MSGPLKSSAPASPAAHELVAIPGQVHSAILEDDIELDASWPNMLRLDANGAARNVDLPDPALYKGVSYEILNTSAGAHALTVRYDGSTVVSIGQDKKSTVVSDGEDWVHMGILTIALS